MPARLSPAAGAATTNADAEQLRTALENDEELRACIAGICVHSQTSLEHFYSLTISRVYTIAQRIVVRDDLVDEVVSDTYMQVWRNAGQYDAARGRVLGWLLTIARTRALDVLRRQDDAISHPEPYSLVTEPESKRAQPEDYLAATQAGTAVHAAMKLLNPVQRQMIALAFFRGLSHAEMAEHTGFALGTVKTHMRRSLEILRTALDIQEYGGHVP